MTRLIPLSYSFSTTSGNQGYLSYSINARELRSFTAYIETDNVGPVLVDVHVLVEGQKHQLGQEGIFDGDGYNAKKLQWPKHGGSGQLPLSRLLPNELIINYSNLCPDDAVIRWTCVVRK